MKLLVSVFCLLLSASVWANKLEELTYITESYPPFNYEEGGQLKGIAIDVLEAATEAVGDPVGRKDVKLQAWARGYASALSGPNVVLFSTTKTKEREPKFKWVGPIIDTKVVVFSAKDVVIKDASELNNYRIGVVRDDIGEQLLQQQGVKSSSLKVSPRADLLVKQIDAGRIDMLAYEETVASYLMKASNIDPSKLKVVYTLSSGQLFYSLSPDTPDEHVEKLQKGLDMITQSGKLDAIKNSY